jgi:internalin A
MYLAHNSFSTFPLEVTRLNTLQQLFLEHNSIASIPPELADLTNLTRLYLGQNPLLLNISYSFAQNTAPRVEGNVTI